MKRAALDRPRAVRTWRRHLELASTLAPLNYQLRPGHLRKGLRIGGCGNSTCRLCHAGKIDGYPTLQESRHNLTYCEQLAEAAV